MAPSPNPTFMCASCQVEIGSEPVFHVGLPFCCAGCVAGGPCICSYDEEPVHEPAQVQPAPALVDDDERLLIAAG